MSLKEILTSITAEKAEQLIGLLKQRESLTKQMSDVDARIESLAAVKGASKTGGARRKPSVEIPELLVTNPTGLTTKQIMTSLGMNYAQVYMTLTKLKKANKVIVNEDTGKYSLKVALKGKK